MRRRLRNPGARRAVGLPIVLALLITASLVEPVWSQSQPLSGQPSSGQPLSGEELFKHRWIVRDPLSPNGDGLGPLFNGQSCVECHHLGGTGGAGANQHNVDLLSVGGSSPDQDGVRPGLLHRFSTMPDYAIWRFQALGFKLRDDFDLQASPRTLRAIEARLQRFPPVARLPKHRQLSHRNTTSLFGVGLIDRIDDSVLVRFAKEQPAQFPGVHGRVARFRGEGIGKFGWRGQVVSLKKFVLTACAMEVGLNSKEHRQPTSLPPLVQQGCFGPQVTDPGFDLTDEQCEALVAYVRSLPAPFEVSPSNQVEVNLLNNGGALFHSVGCSACHPRILGSIEGIYSDLLLHDMGPGLADPVPAPPDPDRSTFVPTSGPYGGGFIEKMNSDPVLLQEWKTPPLWGIRDSAPYLHDGRAATLHDAILLHGGEAESAVRRYRQMAEPERTRLLEFVKSMGVPAPGSSGTTALADR